MRNGIPPDWGMAWAHPDFTIRDERRGFGVLYGDA